MRDEEQGLIRVNSGLLAALASSQIHIDVFRKEILVLECLVAGTSYRQLDNIDADLAATVRLDLRRESRNEFDIFAVALYYKTVKIGYPDDFLFRHAQMIREWVKENKTVYFYFNNTMGEAMKNLLTLINFLRQ